jgi:trk system potassium uptake protein TrkA
MARKQIVVIGLGRFGSSVARALYQMGHDVLAVDREEPRVQELMGLITYPVCADATNEAVLRELGVPNFDSAVVAIGSNIQASIMSTVLLKGFGIPHVTARAQNQLHGQTLERLGANRIVHPEEEMGARLGRGLLSPGILEYMELAGNFGICKMNVPPHISNHTLKEAGLTGARDKYGLAVLAIRRDKDLILLPSEEERLKADDTLILASKDDLLETLLTDKDSLA